MEEKHRTTYRFHTMELSAREPVKEPTPPVRFVAEDIKWLPPQFVEAPLTSYEARDYSATFVNQTDNLVIREG